MKKTNLLLGFATVSACMWMGTTAVAADAPPAPAAAAPAAATPAAAAPAAAAPAAAAPAAAAPTDQLAPNTIYAEGLGAAFLYSINYERQVIDGLGVRLGFSYMSMSASASAGGSSASASSTYLAFPLTASYVGIRGGKHALELGGGVNLAHVSGSGSTMGLSAKSSAWLPFVVVLAGYRIHPVDGAGFNFRVGLMALGAQGLALSSGDPEKFGFIPWGYISMGASF